MIIVAVSTTLRCSPFLLTVFGFHVEDTSSVSEYDFVLIFAVRSVVLLDRISSNQPLRWRCSGSCCRP